MYKVVRRVNNRLVSAVMSGNLCNVYAENGKILRVARGMCFYHKRDAIGFMKSSFVPDGEIWDVECTKPVKINMVFSTLEPMIFNTSKSIATAKLLKANKEKSQAIKFKDTMLDLFKAPPSTYLCQNIKLVKKVWY